MSRHTKQLEESKEAVYGCDDYGYFYLLFDDKNGIPEEDFLIDRRDGVPTNEFIDFLKEIEADPKHISLAKKEKYF
jgi:hypothetical protein